jgi:hypothetical protein
LLVRLIMEPVYVVMGTMLIPDAQNPIRNFQMGSIHVMLLRSSAQTFTEILFFKGKLVMLLCNKYTQYGK